MEGVGIADDALFEQMNERIMAIVNEATDYAEAASYAAPEHALKYVYAEGDEA